VANHVSKLDSDGIAGWGGWVWRSGEAWGLCRSRNWIWMWTLLAHGPLGYQSRWGKREGILLHIIWAKRGEVIPIPVPPGPGPSSAVSGGKCTSMSLFYKPLNGLSPRQAGRHVTCSKKKVDAPLSGATDSEVKWYYSEKFSVCL